MRRSRHPIRRLFVLGAGASYSASLVRGLRSKITTPLDLHLCQSLSNISAKRPKWVGSSRELLVSSWKDSTPFIEFGLEQAVIRQIGHLEFVEAIHPRRRLGAIEPFDWLNHITHLLCFLLRHSKESSNEIYKDFVKKLRLADGHPFDRVVTFNYDDLLDGHLLKTQKPTEVYFDRIKPDAGAPDKRGAKFSDPILVKLHGSVNWRCKREAFESVIRSSERPDKPTWLDPVWLASKGTPDPKDDVYPLMVPPLPVKPITSINLFRYLWTKAYEYLHEAEEVYICGYSLPEADRLAWSLFRNFKNKKLREVTVIDPNPAVMSKWRALFNRSGVAAARWSYFDDFGYFVSNLAP